MINNKRAMLGNLIGGIIVLFIGFTIMTTISQEIMNATTCGGSNATSSMISTLANLAGTDTTLQEEPNGATDSFGGGGATHFGGYDGEVKHNSFTEAVASQSMMKTNKSFLNPDCEPMDPDMARILEWLPGLFAIVVLGSAIMMIYSSLRNGGLLGGGFDDSL